MAEAEIQTALDVGSQEKIYRKITPVLNKGHNDFDGSGIWFFADLRFLDSRAIVNVMVIKRVKNTSKITWKLLHLLLKYHAG